MHLRLNLARKLFIGFAVFILVSVTGAGTINGSGTLDQSSPTFKRPGPTCLGGGSDYKFLASDFVVDTSTTYTISVPANGQVTDPWVQLYRAPFIPSLPLENCIAGDDDSGTGLSAELRNQPLIAGQIYTAVITTYNPTQAGTVNWSITGGGNIPRRNGFIKAEGVENFANGQVSVNLRLSSDGVATTDHLKWVAVPPGSTAPTYAEVIAGHQSGGAPAPASGNLPGQPLDVDVTVNLAGLPVNTPYDIYMTLENGAQPAAVRILDFTPDVPDFAAKTGIAPNTLTESAPVTLTGFTEALAISVTSGEYRINGGAFTSLAGTAKPGDRIVLRRVSANGLLASNSVTFSLGPVTSSFVITTRGNAAGIPTISEWGMFITSALLAAFAAVIIRNRRV